VSEAGKPVYFPEDIRPDVALFGPVTVPHLLQMVPFWAIAFVLFAFLPVSLLGRLLIVAGIGGFGTLLVLANLPRWVAILRRYLKSPRTWIGDRPPGSPGAGHSLTGLSQVAALHGPFLEYADGTWGAILEVASPPWEQLPPEERDLLQGAFELCLRRAAQAKVTLTVFAEVLPDLIPEELQRQDARLAAWQPDSGLARLAAARLNHHRAWAARQARRVCYHLRVAASPGQIELPRRPRDRQDRRLLMKEFLRQTLSGLSFELQRAGLQPVALSADAVRDVAARQVDPATWREAPPPAAPDWAWEAGTLPPPLQGPPGSYPDEGALAEPAPEPLSNTGEPDGPADTAAAVATVPGQESGTQRPRTWTRFLVRWQRSFRRRKAAPARQLLVVVLAGKGGTGLTSVAANLAILIAGRGHRTAALALDGYGDLVSYLGLSVAVSLSDWQTVSDVLWVPGPAGLTVVPGPSGLTDVSIEPALDGVLSAVRQQADVIVADVGHDWNPVVPALLRRASHAWVVATPDRLCWEHTGLAAHRLHAVGVDLGQVGLIVNRTMPGQVPEDLPPLPFGWCAQLPEDTAARVGIPALDAPDSAFVAALERVVAAQGL